MSLPKHIKVLILDMDGVLWRDTAPIGDLPAIFSHIHKLGLKVVLATNNATKTIAEHLEKLANFGVLLEPWQIVSSAQATAETLAKDLSEKGHVFLIGENGINHALEEFGFTPITDPENDSTPIAVVGSLDRSLSYKKLLRATLHIRTGIPFYGTNPDKTFPTPNGLVPGAGSILAAIHAATDVEPIIIGKPLPFMIHIALKRLKVGAEETLVIGDRLETDIAAGQAAGCTTAVVLSGVATKKQVGAWIPKPDLIADNLGLLLD